MKLISDEKMYAVKYGICGLNNEHGCKQVAQAQLQQDQEEMRELLEEIVSILKKSRQPNFNLRNALESLKQKYLGGK